MGKLDIFHQFFDLQADDDADGDGFFYELRAVLLGLQSGIDITHRAVQCS